MTTQINEPVSIADFLSVIRKRWWLLAICMVCFLSLALIYNYKATPIYYASTKVKFENEIVVDQPIKLNEIENRISNLIQVMKTKFFAKNVFEALPEHIKASFSSDSSYTENINLAASATKQIKGNLSAEPTKGTEIITISFESKDPETALIVAQTTTDVLIERNLAHKNKASRHVRRLLEKEIANVDNQLRKAENDLKNFKETNNITVVEDKSQEILRTMSATEGNLNQVKSNIRETQERLHIIKSKLNSEKEALGTTITNPTDPLVRKLREKLVELEARYTKFLAQGYSPYHPKMQELKNEIERIKQKLRDMVENNFENMDDPLSKISSYLEEKSRLETDLQALIAKEKYLTGLLYRYEQLLKQIPTQQKVMVQLIRKRDALTKRYAMLLEERDKAKFKEAAAIGNIRIIEPAELPTGPVRPRKRLNIFVAVFASLVIGSIFIFGLEYLNDSVRSEDALEQALEFPVIASIPKLKHDFSSLFNGNGNGTLHKKNKHEAVLFDEYNLLYSALTHKRRRPCAIMITSSIPNEGKSTIATMLAVTSAQRGERTLLIDADLRRPSLHSFFEVPRNPGLTNLAVEYMQNLNRQEMESWKLNKPLNKLNDPLLKTTLQKGIIQTFEKNLFLLPCGFIPAHPVKAWSSKVWFTLIPHLKHMMDLIIIDAPPIIGVPDSTIMSLYVDHILFCVQADGIKKRTLERSFRLFKNAVKNSDQKIIGTVLTKIDLMSQYGKYDYYKYYSKHYF